MYFLTTVFRFHDPSLSLKGTFTYHTLLNYVSGVHTLLQFKLNSFGMMLVVTNAVTVVEIALKWR